MKLTAVTVHCSKYEGMILSQEHQDFTVVSWVLKWETSVDGSNNLLVQGKVLPGVGNTWA